MKRKRLLSAAGCALVAVAIAGGVAYATIPGPGNVYSACMLKGLGTIRLIDKSLPATNLLSRCTDKETEVSWNQAGQPGPAGAPGAKGEPGVPGTKGTDGTDGANGADGKDGVSVTSAVEPAGYNCANGGSKFTAANGVTYACDGASGGGSGAVNAYQNAGTIVALSGEYTNVMTISLRPGDYIVTVNAKVLAAASVDTDCVIPGAAAFNEFGLKGAGFISFTTTYSNSGQSAQDLDVVCAAFGGGFFLYGNLTAVEVSNITRS
jgi:hypothetical protein